jgi:hypothetical protein
MSLDPNTHFDVVGAGYVPEHHDNGNQRYLSEAVPGVIGGAMAWLGVYAMATVVVVGSGFQKASSFVVASN